MIAQLRVERVAGGFTVVRAALATSGRTGAPSSTASRFGCSASSLPRDAPGRLSRRSAARGRHPRRRRRAPRPEAGAGERVEGGGRCMLPGPSPGTRARPGADGPGPRRVPAARRRLSLWSTAFSGTRAATSWPPRAPASERRPPAGRGSQSPGPDVAGRPLDRGGHVVHQGRDAGLSRKAGSGMDVFRRTTGRPAPSTRSPPAAPPQHPPRAEILPNTDRHSVAVVDHGLSPAVGQGPDRRRGARRDFRAGCCYQRPAVDALWFDPAGPNRLKPAVPPGSLSFRRSLRTLGCRVTPRARPFTEDPSGVG